MKNRCKILFSIVVAATAIVGCSEAEIEEQIFAPGYGTTGAFRVGAYAADSKSSTKVDIDGTAVQWSADDTIAIAEVGEDGAFVGFNYYEVDDSTISADGKYAEFSGVNLVAGKQYIAYNYPNGGVSMESDAESGITSGMACKYDYAKLNVDNLDLIMQSSPFNYDGVDKPEINFAHKSALLELSIKLDPSSTLSDVVDNLVISSATGDRVFLSSVVFDGDGDIVNNGIYCAESSISVGLGAKIDASTTYVVKLPVTWNSAISGANAELTFAITTQNSGTKSITTPVKVIENGVRYRATLTFDKPAGSQDDAWLLVKGETSYPIDYEAQDVAVDIEKNIDYDLDIVYSGADKDWITYTVAPTTRANIVNETIIFTATENTGDEIRTAIITLSNPDNKEQQSTITIDQSPEGALILGQESYDVSAMGEDLEISFSSSSADYSVEVEADAASWIIVPEASRAAAVEEYKMTFTILENTLSEPRSGRLIVTAAGITDYITINQSGQQLLRIEEEDIESGWPGGDVTFTVVHNGEYTIDWDDSNACWEEWTYSVDSPSETQDIYTINMSAQSFKSPRNYGVYNSNTIKVTSVADDTLTDEIFIEQWPHPNMELDAGEYIQTISSAAHDDLTYTIYSNNRILLYNDADWIHLVSAEQAYSSSLFTKYVFSVDANSGIARTATITFDSPYTYASGNHIDEVVTVTQLGDLKSTLTVDCPTAGTLSDLVSEEEITTTTELVITGMINADDFESVVNKIKQLEILDLSGARFENDDMDGAFGRGVPQTPILLEVKLPSDYDTKNIGFSDYKRSIEKIDFGGTTELGYSVCYEFSQLETVVMPNIQGAISEYAFSGSGLRSIVLPEGVTSIDRFVFAGCTALESVTLPSTLVTLGVNKYGGGGVFEGCTALRSIEIPAGVEAMMGENFKGCTALESVIFAPDSKLKTLFVEAGSYDGISGRVSFNSMFEGCTSLKTITIPASVETMDGPIFADSSLEEVIFESGSKLTTMVGGWIGASTGLTSWCAGTVGCFQNAPIKSLTLPESLVELGDYALSNTLIDEISLPSVRDMGSHTFAGTTAHTITLPSVYVVGPYAFADTKNLKTLNIPEVYELGDYALAGSGYATNNGGCFASDKIAIIGSHALEGTGVTSLDLPNLEEAKESAFEGTPLVTVSLPLLETIGNYAFKDCVSLKSVSMPSLTTVGEAGWSYENGNGVFSGCVNLDFSSMVFENFDYVSKIFNGSPIQAVTQSMFPNATKMEQDAFKLCENLTSVDLPNVETISNSAFARCTALESIRFEKVTEVPAAAFYGCKKLKNVDLPSLVRIDNGDGSVGSEGAFSGCTALESFDFEGVEYIGIRAFSSCTSLSTITNVEGVTELSENAFRGCLALKSTPDWSGLITPGGYYGGYAFLESGITEFSASNLVSGKFSFGDCEFLERVYMPKATSIELYPDGCNVLENIEIGTSATSLIEKLEIRGMPYSRVVTLTIGEYDPEKVLIDGNTLDMEYNGTVTFKEIIVVDNIQ